MGTSKESLEELLAKKEEEIFELRKDLVEAQKQNSELRSNLDDIKYHAKEILDKI